MGGALRGRAASVCRAGFILVKTSVLTTQDAKTAQKEEQEGNSTKNPHCFLQPPLRDNIGYSHRQN